MILQQATPVVTDDRFTRGIKRLRPARRGLPRFDGQVLAAAERELVRLTAEIEALYPAVERLHQLASQRENLASWIARHKPDVPVQ